MIDPTDYIIRILEDIEELDGRVYRRWPKHSATTMPAVLVSRIGGSARLTDADGTEIIASLVYSVDINASGLKDADRIASEVADAMARHNFHRTGINDFYDDVLRVYRVILTFSGQVDKRGNTFTER